MSKAKLGRLSRNVCCTGSASCVRGRCAVGSVKTARAADCRVNRTGRNRSSSFSRCAVTDVFRCCGYTQSAVNECAAAVECH